MQLLIGSNLASILFRAREGIRDSQIDDDGNRFTSNVVTAVPLCYYDSR
ncbi:hypothetical protein [Lacipirellula sp.]